MASHPPGGPDDPDDERTVYRPATGGGTTPPPPPAEGPSTPEATVYAPGASVPPVAGVPPPPQEAEQIKPIGVGDVLNGIYQIHRFIARGGMGEVFEGFNVHHPEERVAVKIMLPELARDEAGAAMFAKEASTLTRLQHEYLVQYRLAARDAQGRPFIVTEYIDGPSIEEQLGKRKFDEKQLADLFRRLAAGLGAAHQLGAIHRDIAPDNILLAGGKLDRPKIIDFGIAKDLDRSRRTIVGDGFAGKLKYVAPEQLGAFDREIGAWTDIYSLALVMLAAASGKHADMGGSIADAVVKRNAIPDLSAVPERLRPVFAASLAPDPANRPRDMAELVQLIDRAMGAKPGAARAAGSVAAGGPKTEAGPGAKPGAAGWLDRLRMRPDGGPNWLLIGGGGAAGLLLFVVAVVVLSGGFGGGSDSPPVATKAAPAPPPPVVAIDAAATAAAKQAACSWLTLTGADGKMLRFAGGSGSPVPAQNDIAAAMEAQGIRGVSLDMTKVLEFPPLVCSALEAFRSVRSDQPLLNSPQTEYEMEMRTANNRSEAELLAKVVVRAVNLKTDENIALLEIGSKGELYYLGNSRKAVEEFVRREEGRVTSDGFSLAWDASAVGRSAFVIVAGNGDFPTSLFPSSDDAINVDARWLRQFEERARAQQWRTDILWIEVKDDIPG